jgi:endonuclease/exonuclease/phosphatase (EEP) superfamily protein YafD
MPIHKPPRPYGKLLKSLRQVWKIILLDEGHIWRFGVSERNTGGDVIRIAAWNICKGSGGILFEHDFRIISYQSDIVLLQEVLISKKSLSTFCQPGFSIIHAASYQRADQLRDGVATVTRIAPSKDPLRVQSLSHEPLFKTPKVALITEFTGGTPAQKILIINLHATLIRSAKQARKEINHLLEHCSDHQGPILLCGDFNTFTRKLFDNLLKSMNNFGLEHITITDDVRKKSGKLDHAFSRGLLIERAEVMWTIRSSDHFPLLFHVRIP